MFVEVGEVDVVVFEVCFVLWVSFVFCVFCDDGGELLESVDVEVYCMVCLVGNVVFGVVDEELVLMFENWWFVKLGWLVVVLFDCGVFEIVVKLSGFDCWIWVFEVYECVKVVVLIIELVDVCGGVLFSVGEFVVECVLVFDFVFEFVIVVVLCDG